MNRSKTVTGLLLLSTYSIPMLASWHIGATQHWALGVIFACAFWYAWTRAIIFIGKLAFNWCIRRYVLDKATQVASRLGFIDDEAIARMERVDQAARDIEFEVRRRL